MKIPKPSLERKLIFREWWDRASRAVRTFASQLDEVRLPLDVSELEDRILFSAAPVAVAPEMAQTAAVEPAAASPVTAQETGPAVAPDVRHELVFVDAGVQDIQQMLDDLKGHQDAQRQFDVVVLDDARDGVEQVTSALAESKDLDAIHFLTHGTSESLKLGGAWLNEESLGGYASDISSWRDALANDADILFYGCDVAQNADGQALLGEIQALTGADVAASINGTGNVVFGADWNLEFSIGSIETAVAPSLEFQQDWEGLLSTFVVTNTNDSGGGSLRQAILNANANPGLDTITFNIAETASGHVYYRNNSIAGTLTTVAATTLADGSIADFDPDYPYAPHSWFRIDLNPLSGPLVITSPVFIDGYSQPGATENNLAVGQNAKLRIELTSTGVDGDDGLNFASGANASTIRGLAINGFDLAGIRTDAGVNNVTIQGNFIGTDITGTVDLGNGDAGVLLQSNNNLVGGSNPADRNVLSGNNYSGVSLAHSGADNNQILGNFIGVGATGSAPLGNAIFGVVIWDGAGTNQIGDVTPAAGNIIAYNDRGVIVDANPTNSTFNSIRGNSIYGNTLLGIDLKNDGVTSNDPGDGDTGPNNTHNFPILTNATVNGTDLTVVGTYNSLASLSNQIDFYWSSAGDPSGHPEAQNYIGSKSITTDLFGNASFTTTFVGAAVPAGAVITATATDSYGDTSEFAQNIVATNNAGPVITNNGGGANAAISVPENTTSVTTFTATDPDLPTQTLTYSINGGVDGAKFAINSATGALNFLSAPNFEAPTDVGGNNIYDVIVQVSDGSLTDTQAIAVTVTNINEEPFITSNGGAANATVSIFENTTAVTTVTATDPDLPAQMLTYSISGGADAGKFSINGTTGVLRFVTAPDFEAPTDVGGNNVYDVIVRVSDGTLNDTQAIAVTVSDVSNLLVVTTTADTLGGNTSSIEALNADKGPDGLISLREAVIAANNTAGADTINLPAGTFTFTRAGQNENLSATGDLDLTQSVTILGAGVGVSRIDANGFDRVFQVLAGALTLSDLTIQGGVTPASDWGGGIRIDNSAAADLSRVVVTNNSSGSGAGIYNYGTLTAVDAAITNNAASDWGGGVYNDRGNVSLERVTISNNSAGKDGGGIENTGSGAVLSLVNVTLSSNTATTNGGGLWTNRAVTAVNATIAFNSAAAGDGLYGQGGTGTVSLKNSLLFNPAGSNSNKAMISLGNNLDSDGSAGLLDPSDFNNVNPLLNALSANGGVGQTHALLAASSAINGGTAIGAPTVDQRNVARDATPDIGAFEFVFVGNLPPTITSNGGGNSASVSISENSTTVATVVATDPDLPAQALTFSIAGGADAGLFAINASTGALSFLTAPNFESPTDAGADNVYNVVVETTDGSLVDAQAMAVSVTNINEAPIAVGNSYSVNEDTTLSIPVAGVLANDTDPEGNALTAVLVSNVSSGTLTLNPNGSFTYIPTANIFGGDFFTYRANDGSLSSNVVAVTISVNPVNDAPTVSLANASLNYAEQAAPLTIDSGLTIGDIDNATLAGATVTITNGSLSGPDELLFTPVAGISGAFNAATDTLTFTGIASVTDYQTLLRSVQFRNLSDTPFVSTRTLTFTVTDGAATGSDSRDVHVTKVNDPPTINVANPDLTFVEGSPPLIIDSGLTFSDVDNTRLNGATVRISANFRAGQDVLTITSSGPITSSYNAATGVLTLTGDESLAEYRNVLRTVAYRNSSATPDTSPRTITFEINDGAATATDSRIVLITATNAPPTLNPATFGLAENSVNGTVVGSVTASDPDVGDTRSFAIIAGNVGSAFAINATTGQITVANSAVLNFETTPTFSLTVQVSDAGGLQDTATVTVNLTNVNEAPTLNPATISLAENAANGTVVGMATATDPDAGNSRSFAITGGNVAGAFAINATTGRITVANSAALNFETTPTFNLTVRVTDAGGLQDTATVTVNLTNVNEAPTLNPATFGLAENSANGTVVSSATATDPDIGDTRTFAITAGNTGSAFAIDSTNGQITVANSAAINFETTPVFNLTVRVTDGGGLQDTATVTVNLTNVNEAPTLNPATFGLAENAADGTVVGSATVIDPDVGDTRSFAITGGNVDGAFTINATTGRITVANSASLNFETTPTFNLTVRVTDASGLQDNDSVTINLTNVNEAPTLNSATFSLAENSVNGTLVGIATATDPDVGDTSSFAIIAGNLSGAFTINSTTGQITVTDSNGLNFEANPVFNLIVRITDVGGRQNTGNVTINLTDVNDDPIITSNGAGVSASVSVVEDTTAVTTVMATDADLPAQTLSYSISGGADAGQFVIDGSTGMLRFASAPAFQPPTDANGDGVYVVTVQATDGQGGVDAQTISVTVPQNGSTIPSVAPAPVTQPGSNPPPTPPSNNPPPVIIAQPIAANVSPTAIAPSPPTAPTSHVPEFAPPPTSTSAVPPAVSAAVSAGDVIRVASHTASVSGASSNLRLSTRELSNSFTHSESDVSLAPQSSLDTAVYAVFEQPGAFWKSMDEVQETVGEELQTQTVMVGTALATATGISVGYVLWLARSGVLLTSLLAQLPAWRRFDPLVILDYADDRRGKDSDDEETLEDVIATTSFSRHVANR